MTCSGIVYRLICNILFVSTRDIIAGERTDCFLYWRLMPSFGLHDQIGSVYYLEFPPAYPSSGSV